MAGVLYDPTKPMPLIQMVNSPLWQGVKPTVGQRNNNPGNLRSFDDFQGKTGQGKGGYDIYDTMDNGARALARDLHTKSKRGVRTVRELMTGYAPPSDNNPTGSYIDYVANDLGVDPDQEIDIANMRPKLMRSITKFENKNRDILSDDMIAQAIAAADGKPVNEGTGPMNWMQGYYQDGAGQAVAPTAQTAAPPPPALANIPPQNNQTLPPQDDDGYGAMRLLNFTEAQIAEAKRRGVPAEFYTAQAGLNNGVLAEPNANLDPEADVSLRGPTRPSAGMVLASDNDPSFSLISEAQAATLDDVIARQGDTRQAFQDQYTATTSPALTMPSNETQSQGILANPGYTNNTRSQTPLSITPPNQGIDFAERMVRMGAAGLGAMDKGPAAQMAAMGREDAAINDMQRASLEKYRLAELKAKKGKTNAAPQQSPYTGVVLDTIDTIFAQVEEGGNDMLWPFDNVTGGIGKALSYIPGSPAHDVASNIDTIVSSIGFDRLQKMRDDSPTGGALGAISEKELALLNSALGSLRQSQSREQFLKNLRRVKTHYQASVQAIREQQIEYARINGLPVPAMTVSGQAAAGNQAASSNLDAARAIISQR